MNLAIVWLTLLAIEGTIQWLNAPVASHKIFHIGLQMVSFATLTGSLLGAAHLLVASPQTVNPRAARIFVMMCSLPFVGWTLFRWLFLVNVGTEPSDVVVTFISNEPLQLLLHVIQTAPSLCVGFIFICVSSAWLLIRASERQNPALLRLPAIRSVHVLMFAAIGVGAKAFSSATSNHDFFPAMFQESFGNYPTGKIDTALAKLPSKRETIIRNNGQSAPSVVVLLVESLRHDLFSEHPDDVRFLGALRGSSISFERSYASSSHSNLSDIAF